MVFFFLTSGLFLGWSLGANHAANVFGTAVASKMVRFGTAALLCSVFVVLGAVVEGAGASGTLHSLGAVNALAGAFMVTLSAGLSVSWMTRLKLPVSTSQAIIGAILGWNLFSGSATDFGSLARIVSSWIAAILLTATISAALYVLIRALLKRTRIHLLTLDSLTRVGLIVVGAFGAYSLGANNIANVMGVFVPVVPFRDIGVAGLFTLTGVQQLFFLGGVAIAVGVFTFSRRVIQTVGNDLLRMSPIAAFIVVFAESLVLFLFSSRGLESWLMAHGLPTIPLVPISSSQAVIGGIIGIGIVNRGREIRYRVLGDIALGWLVTPLLAGTITFFGLFILQNVFQQEVYRRPAAAVPTARAAEFRIDGATAAHLEKTLGVGGFGRLRDIPFRTAATFDRFLARNLRLSATQRRAVLRDAEAVELFVDPLVIRRETGRRRFTDGQMQALRRIENASFRYRWQLFAALERFGPEWRARPDSPQNRNDNLALEADREALVQMLRTTRDEAAAPR